MRGAVPVLFTSHLFKLTVTRHVSALNPALRIPPNVTCYVKRRPCNKTTTRFDGLTFDICRKNGEC